MTDLARFMGVSAAAMTGMVDRLVRDGYVTRAYKADDRRVIKIRLTGKASEVLKKIDNQRRNTTIRIFGKISPSERQAYLKTLVRIRDILQQEKED
jgi:DNA-binding MarR family transcriptional regulator